MRVYKEYIKSTVELNHEMTPNEGTILKFAKFGGEYNSIGHCTNLNITKAGNKI